MTATNQQTSVAELIRKIRYNEGMNFTFLHENERLTLAEYVIENDPINQTAQSAMINDDFDIHDLALDAERIIRKSFPSIIQLWD